jgi:glycosyltransferase involved in cell wall biosynthesis
VPKISVLMPVYNEEKYIRESVTSIIKQSFNDFELIVVDDGSTDRTWEILCSINSEKLKIFNFGKIGKNGAFNKAFEMSSGKWILFFGGDDIMPAGSLQDRYEGVKIYNENQKVVGYSQLKITSDNKRFDGMHLPKNRNKGLCSGGTTIFSRTFASAIFPIPEGYPNEDIWTSLHFNHFYEKKIHIPIVATIYRVHSGNSLVRTSNFNEINDSLHSRYLIYKEFLKKYINTLDETSKIRLQAFIYAEDYRFNKRPWKIVVLTNLTIKEKVKMIFHSNKYLYLLKYNLSRFFIGW